MTFAEWLKSKTDRKDIVGDLARTTAADLLAPKGDARLAHWKEHLEDNKARPVMFRALDEACASTACCADPTPAREEGSVNRTGDEAQRL